MSDFAVSFGGRAEPSVRPNGLDYLRGDQRATDSKAAANRLRVAELNGIVQSVTFELPPEQAAKALEGATNKKRQRGWQHR